MDYEAALGYLAELTKFGINLGLGRIEELLRRLGNPHRRLSIAHVGGTNGKGSTGAMLASILEQAGYRTGLFTSPHLHSYCERFRVNGREIRKDQAAELITELRPHIAAMRLDGYEHPTEFEVSTALAFLYFFREQVDILVLEVGMGGAFDSTNVVCPVVTIITNVSLDHMDYLGHTVAAIAGTKSGIIKPGTPLITAATGEALEVLEAVCEENKAPIIRCRKESAVDKGDAWKKTDPGRRILGLQQGLTQDFLVLARQRRVTRRSVLKYVTERREEANAAKSKKDKSGLTQDFLVLARQRRVTRRSVLKYVTERREEANAAKSKKDKSGVIWRRLFTGPAGQWFTVCGGLCDYENMWLPLLGEHQLANGAVAVAAAEQLGLHGFKLGYKDIRNGLANTRWPGRLEIVAGSVPVLLDGAHNHAGAKSLVRAVADHFPHKKLILVLGMLPDKEQAKMMEEFARLAKTAVVTRPDHPRATGWRCVATLTEKYIEQVFVLEKVSEALDKAFSLAGPDDLICVTGSLYLVAEARGILLSL